MRILAVFLCALLSMAKVSVAQSIATDSGKPIEITANTLEVFQDKNLAMFSGNVEAIQGNIRLYAEKMQVHYRSESSAEQNQISRIDVDGAVRLVAPEETARGNSGVYNVDDSTLFLVGDVLLTRGDNVIKGQRLDYNLKTGQSKIAADGASGVATGAENSGRVKGVFFPGKK